jgi:F plasmid transfer operon, TraF, protein
MLSQQKKYAQRTFIFFALTGLLSVSTSAIAGQPYVLHGSALTTGPGSSEYSLQAGSFNPAMSSLMVDEDENWRLGYLPSVMINIEFGDVQNFADDLEDLIDIIDDPSLATDSVDETLTRFNNLLPVMGEEGYLKNTASLHYPLFVKSDFLGGSLQTEISYVVQMSGRVLDDTLIFNQQNETFSTNTSMYLKSGLQTAFSLGYSRPVFEKSSEDSSSGTLFVGTKISAIKLDLSKQVFWLEGIQNDEIEDVIRDEYDKNTISNFGINVDLGAVWDANNYRVGLTLSHLNKPTFDYNAVGINCEQEIPGSTAADNCNVAQYFVEIKPRLKAKEVHEMTPVATVDLLLKLSKKWQITSSMDLASYNDMVGFDNQHLHLATRYETESVWIPSPRIGYTKNLAGEELTSISAGLTFFNVFNLDINYGKETTVVDGDKFPRVFGVAFGFDEKF